MFPVDTNSGNYGRCYYFSEYGNTSILGVRKHGDTISMIILIVK